MRISVLEQVKAFLKDAKNNNSYVFESKELKLTVKNYLIQKKMLYAPIRWIYILKKSEQFDSEVLEKYKYEVLAKLWWVFTGDFAIAYYLWDISFVKDFEIITEKKNFSSVLWQKYNLKFKASKVPRKINNIQIENIDISIENPISLYINNYKNISEDSDFVRYLMTIDISPEDIIYFIENKFKFSGISKLALLYKQNWFWGKHKVIMGTLREAGKQIDYRKATTQKTTTKNFLNIQTDEDLDSLI